MQSDLFPTREPAPSKADAKLARLCRYHTRILAQSRHAVTRSQADRVARMYARQIADAALRRRLYEAIVVAAMEMTERERDADA